MFELEMVSEIKFLGVIIDHKLSWKSHITYKVKHFKFSGYPV